ncbi:hypothetical protein DFAR_3500010 [Desulfarculales bacterium]
MPPGKDEVKALKTKVPQALAKKGPEVIKEFNDPKSCWTAESYIFAYQLDCTCLALPHGPMSQPWHAPTAWACAISMARPLWVKMVKQAKSHKGEGWVEYKNISAPTISRVRLSRRLPG